MAFETRTEPITCKMCGAEHNVRWHRIPVRDRAIVRCITCGETMLNANTVRDYDEPTLVRRF